MCLLKISSVSIPLEWFVKINSKRKLEAFVSLVLKSHMQSDYFSWFQPQILPRDTFLLDYLTLIVTQISFFGKKKKHTFSWSLKIQNYTSLLTFPGQLEANVLLSLKPREDGVGEIPSKDIFTLSLMVRLFAYVPHNSALKVVCIPWINCRAYWTLIFFWWVKKCTNESSTWWEFYSV